MSVTPTLDKSTLTLTIVSLVMSYIVVHCADYLIDQSELLKKRVREREREYLHS